MRRLVVTISTKMFLIGAACSGGDESPAESLPPSNSELTTTTPPSTSIAPEVEPADTVLLGGKIVTSNPDQPLAEALAIDGDRIVAVGSDDEVSLLIGETTAVAELDGRLVLPGLIDSHTHPGLFAILGAEEENEIPDGTLEDIQAWLADLAATSDEPVLTAASWSNTLFGPDGPRKEWLDEVVDDRPVLLYDESGHSQWVNSVTLDLLGIDASTPDPAPGLSEFGRDANGSPTGYIREFGIVPSVGDLFLDEEEVLNAAVKEGIATLSASGVTTVMDAGNLIFHDNIYSYVAELEAAGELPLRYEGSYHIIAPNQVDLAIDEVNRMRAGFAGELLMIDTIKIHFDGVLEIGTAAVLDPYANDPTNSGAELLSAERVARLLVEMEGQDMQLHVHTVGGRAVRTVLDAVEAARSEVGGDLATQVTLSHIELLDPADVGRSAELGVIANYTPHWHGEYGEQPSSAHRFIGDERDGRKHPARVLEDAGAIVSYSSDVIDATELSRVSPFFGMQIGATRREPTIEGAPATGTADEALTVDQLIRGYTINGAHQLQRATEIGSLEIGKRADLVVLDRDITAIDPEEIDETAPVLVMVNGDITHGTLNP